MNLTGLEQLQMCLALGAVRQSAIPLPKTTRMRHMRTLKAAGLAVSEQGTWHFTGKGYAQWFAPRRSVDTSLIPDSALVTLQIDDTPIDEPVTVTHPRPLLVRLLVG